MTDYTENTRQGLANDEWEQARYEFDAFIREMYACLPCRVIAVSDGGVAPVGSVDIKPLVSQRTAAGRMKEFPIIHNAPYFRLQGGSNAIVIDPQVGDLGFAVFSSRDISGVKRARGDAATASLRKYSLSDAIYVNGIMNAAPVQYIHFSGDGIIVHSPTKITCQAPQIILEGASSVTLDTPLVQITGQMTQTGEKGSGAQTSGGITNTGGTITSNGVVLETHVHKGVTPGSGNTGEPV